MKIQFFEPPEEQKVGGLNAAIDSLRIALESLGHEVRINGEAPNLDLSLIMETVQ